MPITLHGSSIYKYITSAGDYSYEKYIYIYYIYGICRMHYLHSFDYGVYMMSQTFQRGRLHEKTLSQLSPLHSIGSLLRAFLRYVNM